MEEFFSFDEVCSGEMRGCKLTPAQSMLQTWAADCLPSMSTSQPINPFDSLNDLLFPTTLAPATPASISSRDSNNLASQTAMLSHYRECLSTLVSCSNGEHAPNAFDGFTFLANANISSPSGQGLHLSILAWAGRHMVNQGQTKYEAVSERLGLQAAQIIMDTLARNDHDDKVAMTLFAGLLMMVQFKVSCLG